MPKDSWFNKIRKNAGNYGVVINGLVHKCSPIRKGNTWARGKCPKCNRPNGFVFRSHMDGKTYVLFCIDCNPPSDVIKDDNWKWEMVKFSHHMKDDMKPKSMENRCHAITARGNRCSYKCVPHSKLCSIHESIQKEGRAVNFINDDDTPNYQY
jgi:hypothetical protein